MTDTATTTADMITALPVDQVHPSPDNVRSGPLDVEGLAQSIKDSGLIQPIVVAPDGDGWTIIAGHRRHAAHVELGKMFIDAIVREDLDAPSTTAARIIENVQRQDLAPSDEARAYHRLAGLDWSQRQIADAVGVSQGQVSKRIKLASLPDAALRALDQGRCTVEDLLHLATLTDEDPDAADDLVRSEMFSQAEFELAQSRKRRKRAEVLQEARDAHEAGEGPPVHPASDEGVWGTYEVRGVEPVGSFALKDVTREQMLADGTLALLVDRAGKIHEVCTAPRQYLKQAAAARKKSPGEVAAERRRAFVATLMQSDDEWEPPAHFRMLITLLTDEVIGMQNSMTLRQAVDWLGIPLKKSASHGELRDALRGLLAGAEGPGGNAGNEKILNARRIAQAILWTRADHWLGTSGTSRYGGTPDFVIAYLDQLVANGYEPTDDEEAVLEADRELDVCDDCGQHHDTVAEAMACDEEGDVDA